MEREKHLSCILLFLHVFGMITHSACQYYQCTEFQSPMKLDIYGSAVGTIQVPVTGKTYDSDQMCEWTIETESKGYIIQLDVVTCSLQGKDIFGSCNNDYVDIFDFINDEEVFIDRFCGVDKGKSYKTTGNKMIVRFHSDMVLEFAGFQASYQSVPVDSNDGDALGVKAFLGMTIGIPVGVLILTVVVVLVWYMLKQHHQKKAADTGSPATTAHQNRSSIYPGLPGGNPSSAMPEIAEGQNVYFNNLMSREDHLDPHYRNQPLQVSIPPVSFHDNIICTRSITPPPNYDSLILSENSDMRQSPPPYEMIAGYKTATSFV